MPSVTRGFVSIPQGQLHYRMATPSYPSGATPLVLFPGAGESAWTLHRLVALIGQTRSAVAFDALGQGDSSPPPHAGVTLDAFVDAARDGIAALGPGFAKVDLFGTHAGARLAAELAIRQPAAIGKVALDSIRSGPSPFWLDYAERLDLSHLIDQNGSQFIGVFNRRRDSYLFFPPHERQAKNWRGSGLPPADVMHDSVLERLKGIRTSHIFYRLAIAYPASERLPLLTRPTLFTSTPKDDRFGDLARVSLLVPGSQSAIYRHDETLDTASDEAMSDFAAQLTDWLDSNIDGVAA